MNKRTFKIEINGTEKEIAVKLPNAKQKKMSNILYAKSFKDYVESGLFVRDSLESHMRTNGLWDDRKQQLYENLQDTILKYESILNKGGIKKSEGRQAAVDLIRARRTLTILLAERNRLDRMTAEGMADNDKFNYLISVCTVYNDTGTPVFKSLEDYEERAEEDVANQAATTLMALLYELEEDFQQNLPEQKFLRKYHYVDKDSRFINEAGELVNMDGKRVNEEGYLIGDDGNIIEEVAEEVEPQPFLDDDGQPILDEEAQPALDTSSA